MKLKRFYQKSEGWVRQVNARLPSGELMVPSMAEGDCLNPPALDYVELQHTGTTPEQNFSDTLIEGALKEGWARFSDDGSLILDVSPEPLRYKINRTPGRYCCHCSARLDEDVTGAKAREHVATEHAGVTSPDKANPAGYVRTHSYDCVLNSTQHERYNFQQVFADKVKNGKKRNA